MNVPVQNAPSGEVAQSLQRLREIAEQIERNATRLAVSLGNCRGTKDFADEGHSLWCGNILYDDFARDQVAIVIVRAYALLAPHKFNGDATLHSACGLLGNPDVAALIPAEARNRHSDALLSASDERIAGERLTAFLALMQKIDVSRLRDHRNWVLAHSTTNRPSPVLVTEALAMAETVLTAARHLIFIMLGRNGDLVDLSKAYRESTLAFWRALRSAEAVYD